MNFLEDHAGKLGTLGTVGTITAQTFSHLAAGLAALVTVAAVLPVAIRRWRGLRKRPVRDDKQMKLGL